MKYSFIYRSAGGSFETVRAALKTNEASLSLIRVISSSNIGEFESRVHCRVSEALLNKRRGENLGNLFSVSRILGIIITIKECRNSAHGRGRVVTLDGNGWFVTKTGEIVSFPSLERINPKSISSVGEIRGERESCCCSSVETRWGGQRETIFHLLSSTTRAPRHREETGGARIEWSKSKRGEGERERRREK